MIDKHKIEFAKHWIFTDIRDAFPELNAEMVARIAEKLAPKTAEALDAAWLVTIREELG
jgi:hypothetical protein